MKQMDIAKGLESMFDASSNIKNFCELHACKDGPSFYRVQPKLIFGIAQFRYLTLPVGQEEVTVMLSTNRSVRMRRANCTYVDSFKNDPMEVFLFNTIPDNDFFCNIPVILKVSDHGCSAYTHIPNHMYALCKSMVNALVRTGTPLDLFTLTMEDIGLLIRNHSFYRVIVQTICYAINEAIGKRKIKSVVPMSPALSLPLAPLVFPKPRPMLIKKIEKQVPTTLPFTVDLSDPSDERMVTTVNLTQVTPFSLEPKTQMSVEESTDAKQPDADEFTEEEGDRLMSEQNNGPVHESNDGSMQDQNDRPARVFAKTCLFCVSNVCLMKDEPFSIEKKVRAAFRSNHLFFNHIPLTLQDVPKGLGGPKGPGEAEAGETFGRRSCMVVVSIDDVVCEMKNAPPYSPYRCFIIAPAECVPYVEQILKIHDLKERFLQLSDELALLTHQRSVDVSLIDVQRYVGCLEQYYSMRIEILRCSEALGTMKAPAAVSFVLAGVIMDNDPAAASPLVFCLQN